MIYCFIANLFQRTIRHLPSCLWANFYYSLFRPWEGNSRILPIKKALPGGLVIWDFFQPALWRQPRHQSVPNMLTGLTKPIVISQNCMVQNLTNEEPTTSFLSSYPSFFPFFLTYSLPPQSLPVLPTFLFFPSSPPSISSINYLPLNIM